MKRKDYFIHFVWGIDRLRVNYRTDKGEMIDFVIQYETFLNGKWKAVVRYDCAHGFFHRDEIFPTGEKEKTPIDINNFDSAALYAEQDLRDRWKWYKERYFKKIKKKNR